MALQENKKKVIQEFQLHPNDTGSMEVQIALLTDRISRLTEHFKKNAKDFGSKRGLLMLVGQRRRYLNFVERYDKNKYKELIERLGLRK